MTTDRIEIVLTYHAVKRMRERASDPRDIISFLRKSNEVVLLENHQGFEIPIPLKGRLVGDFDGDHTFIAKSFLPPFRFGRDYYVNGRESRFGCSVRVSFVLLPGNTMSGDNRWNSLRSGNFNRFTIEELKFAS